jgi:hypothetical protein
MKWTGSHRSRCHLRRGEGDLGGVTVSSTRVYPGLGRAQLRRGSRARTQEVAEHAEERNPGRRRLWVGIAIARVLAASTIGGCTGTG